MSSGITFSFPRELLSGVHNFSSDTFCMALYASDIDQSLPFYTTANEIAGAGYPPGGVTVPVSLVAAANTTSVAISQAEFAIPSAAVSLLIYNASKNNRSVFVSRVTDATSAGSLSVNFTAPLISLAV